VQISSQYPVSLKGMYDFFHLNRVSDAGAIANIEQSMAQVHSAIDEVVQLAYDNNARVVQMKQNLLSVSA